MLALAGDLGCLGGEAVGQSSFAKLANLLAPVAYCTILRLRVQLLIYPLAPGGTVGTAQSKRAAFRPPLLLVITTLPVRQRPAP